MSSNAKKKTRSMSTLNIVLIIQLIIMLGLSVFITLTVSSKTKENAIDHMKAIGEERSKIIENFVDNAEKSLTYFSRSPEVLDVLKRAGELSWQDLQTKLRDGAFDNKAAQEYTAALSNDIGPTNEGLWVGSLDTIVINHTNDKILGMMTRKEAKANENDPDVPAQERIDQLINSLNIAGDNGVYNTGIIISPGSGEQCLSLYKGVFDNGKLIGFVGLGIYTQGLLDTLNAIKIPDMENATYSMANLKANADGEYTYIFNSKIADKITKENAADVTKAVDQNELLDIIENYKDVSVTDEDVTDEYEYSDGDSMVATYTVIPSQKWILTVDDTTSEVYALNRTMIIYLTIFAVIILGLTVVFYFITKRQQAINEKLVSTIAKQKSTKKSLNTAMFKDVLTGVNNRISLSMDIEKMNEGQKVPRYFAMFNICNFSDINIKYGEEAGDRMLVRAVEDLKEHFEEEDIYRTGSDEFVVMVKTENGAPSSDEMLNRVNLAFRQMIVAENLEGGRSVYPTFKVAVVKKSGDFDLSVVTTLKDMTNKSGEATYGMIELRDLL